MKILTAVEAANRILTGAQVFQAYNPKATLVALYGGVYCNGPAPSCMPAVVEGLRQNGWEWSEERGVREFYTGHDRAAVVDG